MTQTQADRPAPRKPLRLWPGVVAAIALLMARFGVKAVIPGFRGFSTGMMWSFGAAALVLLWWLLLSRARWFERLGGLLLIAGGVAAAWSLRHESMGPLWLAGYALPLVSFALVAGAVAARALPDGWRRRATIAAAILLACGVWTLVRTDGISGDHDATFTWRWSASPEERLLAQASLEPQPSARAPAAPATVEPMAVPSASPSVAATPSATTATRVPVMAPPARDERTPQGWPGFRGRERDGIVHGVRIGTHWAASPPALLWRRPIGPGWSSFAVEGERLYTQEQRGDDEVVACYRATGGEPLWAHHDPVRFFESNAGAGPRGTPTLDRGRVYAFGATGLLNALDASDGSVAWSRDVASEAGVPAPTWGFSSSPLVTDDLVVVAAAGQLVAYDRATGQPRWRGPSGGVSYSSPHLLTIDGTPQVLLLSAAGATGVALADGRPLWAHAWRGFPIVQPARTAEGDLLITASGESGTRRIAVSHAGGAWSVEERWRSMALKPYFNDFVVHEGHAYGFDGRILACLDVADGTRKWKGGRYGNGQLVLLADQDLLLVLTEEGELALVRATPDQFTELARVPALEGKTWNHPVLVGDLLLARNSEQMVAFRMPAER